MGWDGDAWDRFGPPSPEEERRFARKRVVKSIGVAIAILLVPVAILFLVGMVFIGFLIFDDPFGGGCDALEPGG